MTADALAPVSDRPPPIACPRCTRWFGDARALAQHATAKHGETK